MDKIVIKVHPASLEIYPKSTKESWSVSVDTSGLFISQCLEENPDANEHTIIESWIECDIKRIEETAERKMDKEESGEIIEFLRTYYHNCRG